MSEQHIPIEVDNLNDNIDIVLRKNFFTIIKNEGTEAVKRLLIGDIYTFYKFMQKMRKTYKKLNNIKQINNELVKQATIFRKNNLKQLIKFEKRFDELFTTLKESKKMILKYLL